MLWLSEVLISGHELNDFDELIVEIKARAKQGEMHFRMDVKPTFVDTPEDWENILEAAFTSPIK